MHQFDFYPSYIVCYSASGSYPWEEIHCKQAFMLNWDILYKHIFPTAVFHMQFVTKEFRVSIKAWSMHIAQSKTFQSVFQI